MSAGRAGNGAITHHPSEATLLGYTTHALGPAARIVVEAHLDRCPQCRATTRMAEDLGGLLLDSLAPTPLDPSALERALSSLGNVAECETPPPSAASATTLHDLLGGARLRWIAPGVHHALLLREGGDSSGVLRLLRVRSGMALPCHAHRAVELTLVLEGAFIDEVGRYGPGDLAEVDAGASHQPVAEGPGDCVCLLSTQGRLGFHNPLARLFGILKGL
ncbi:MAG: ChrR family anti-sigma-E factor [Paracraurococcus sp.]|jgi:putative transcriptional regulator